MKKTYQGTSEKSKNKFEVVGERGLLVEVPLPLVEVWEELQPEVEHLTGMAGLQIIRAVIEEEVTRRVGPRHHPDAEAGCMRWGQQRGYVMFSGQKVPVSRPRVRARSGQEVELENYARLQHDGRRQRAVREGLVAGLSTRNYHRAVESVLDGYGIETSGKKHVLGLWQGATENTAVVKDLLEDLVARGLSTERRYLFVIDGAKALRAAIKRVFGSRAEVQRCQLHKRRNIKEYLPKNAQGDFDRRIRNAYAMTEYASAKAELEKIFRQLERVNPSAARSLEEGMEETLTVHRLGVGGLLRRSLATTNPIESCLSTVERVARNVKRWHAGDQALRWTATGLLEAEKKFRRVKGYRELAALQGKLNPSLTQQVRVA